MLIKEQVEKVRVLRLAAPPSNVLNLTLLETLKREVAEAAGDARVRCLVLASSYPRYFSTGLDLAELAGLPRERQAEPFEALLDCHRALLEFPKPTLAAVSGAALLGGWILAMACDFRLLSKEHGKISLSEIRLGLSPSGVLVKRLMEISSNPSLVKAMALRGRTLRSAEALAGGFVDRAVEAERLNEEAMKEARSLAKLAPPAYASIKRALARRAPGDEEALRAESREDFGRLLATAEAREGIKAMREKRRPRWEARCSRGSPDS